MRAIDCVNLLFQNKLSRNLLNLNNRIIELKELGFNLPPNILSIMARRGWIKRMGGHLSLVHFQRGDNLKEVAKSAWLIA